METTCAVCRLSDGLVLNIIVASPSNPAPDGCQLVEVMAGQVVAIGWYYIGGVFHGPRTFATCAVTINEVVSLSTVSYVSPLPSAPYGYYIVEVVEGLYCDIGWTWDGSKFNPPVG